MTLCQFLNFNDTCPVCDKGLTLYMHVNRGALWKAELIGEKTYKFSQHLLKKDELGKNDYMLLYNYGDHFETKLVAAR